MTKKSNDSHMAVFFGSGPVAAKCLDLLLQHTKIEAVITKPRPAQHKGDTPVLDVAARHHLPIFTATSKIEVDSVLANHSFMSSYAVLIDFGIIISQKAINSFPYGIINSHFSLLPHLRGADPITFAILEGAQKTGVSLMLVDSGMDTGKLLTSRTIHLTQRETTPELTNRLIDLSDQLIQQFIPLYLNGELTPRRQPHQSRATYSRKLTKNDGTIDWNDSAEAIERKIRAFIEWPQSRTKLGQVEVIITEADVIEQSGDPGTHTASASQLIIYASSNALSIKRLKPAGKKEMPIQAFLAGYKSKI